jgi:hypothetical protein
MLSAAQLTAMRTQHQATFDQSCAIKRKTKTTDGMGGFTFSLSTVATVLCHVREEQKNTETVVGDSVRGVTYFTLWVPHGTDIRPEDQVAIGSYDYEIVEGDEGKSYSLNVQCRMVRVEGVTD